MKKKPSTFSRVTKIFVWLMLIVTIAGAIFSAVISLGGF